jgi:serine/threonine-protein kinase
MEFVAGKSLQQLLEAGGAMPADRVLKIVRQITGALEEAHQQGIVHRDLKPDNVVLTDRSSEKDVVKLLDFGIAARTDSVDAQREQKLTQQGMVLGTPPYMSPEQFTGKALDLRSDIYSLGVMAYEMVTGGLPFDAQTPWQWATEHMTSQPKPFEASPVAASIPPAMRAAILRSLAKNREDRQSSVREFYEELAGERQGVVAAAQGSTGTAMMNAPPQFAGGGGSAKTAAMPSGGGVGTGPAVAAPMIAPPRSGGGKGLIIGLASVGGALLIGMVVVLTRNGSGGGEVPIAATETAPTPAAPAKIAPAVDPTDTAPPLVAPPPEATPPQPTPATGTKPPPAKPAPSAQKPPEQPTPVTPPPVTPPPAKPTPPPEAPRGDPCQACLAAASAGNIPSAAASYNRCSDAGQKSSCAGIVRGRAPAAAKAAAFNGNCAQAKAIAAGGQAMGVPAKAFGDVQKNCP